jgi:hypothetical protein
LIDDHFEGPCSTNADADQHGCSDVPPIDGEVCRTPTVAFLEPGSSVAQPQAIRTPFRGRRSEPKTALRSPDVTAFIS